MRGSALFCGFFLLLVPACKCSRKTPPPPALVALPASVTPVPADFRPSEALFDPDPNHPFNRVHRALFSRKVPGSVSACLNAGAGACRKKSPMAILGGASEPREIELGGDEPTLFIGMDVGFLAESLRADEVERAITDALVVAPSVGQTAAVLLQNDLWERYDVISRELGSPRAGTEELTRIRRRIVELMRAIALSSEQLRSLPANLPEVEVAYPDLLGGVTARKGWVELRSSSSEQPGESSLQEGTRHARQAGNRISFRVLVRVPESAGGSDLLVQRLEKKEAQTALPPDTRLLLVASPLAIAKGGEIVPVPLVVLIELRVAREKTPDTLLDAPFDVLEGRRALLTRQGRPGGGLERLAADTPIPMGATCSPIPAMQVPLRATCGTCHAGQARITGPMSHGETRLELEDDPARAAKNVANEKAKDPSFAQLVRAFREK